MIRAAFAFATAALLVGCGGGVEKDQSHEQGLCPPSHDFIDGRCQMRQIYVPGGTFVMGRGYCPKANAHEIPPKLDDCPFADAPHGVTVAPFLVDATLRSGADYECQYQCENPPKCPSRSLDCMDAEEYTPITAAEPLCEEFGMRAITEAEWDFVATWGGTRTYPWGDQIPTCENAYFDQTCTPINRTMYGFTRVASYPPTAEGIYDLEGNGPELVEPSPDAYGDGYTPAPTRLPECPEGTRYFENDWAQTAKCRLSSGETWAELAPVAVARGSGWAWDSSTKTYPQDLRSAARRGYFQFALSGPYRCGRSAE